VKRAKNTGKGIWGIAGVTCLLRHKFSRKYYGRFTIRGKQKWINLDTTVLTVAQLRLADEVKEIEKPRMLEPNVGGRAPDRRAHDHLSGPHRGQRRFAAFDQSQPGGGAQEGEKKPGRKSTTG
jgi:hypothetical protein